VGVPVNNTRIRCSQKARQNCWKTVLLVGFC